MTEGKTAGLLEDWVTIWHSEMSALIHDREVHEAAQRITDAWAAHATALARIAGTALDAAAGHAGTGPPPRAATPRPAPDERGEAIASLLARVAELERRLARVERPQPAPPRPEPEPEPEPQPAPHTLGPA